MGPSWPRCGQHSSGDACLYFRSVYIPRFVRLPTRSALRHPVPETRKLAVKLPPSLALTAAYVKLFCGFRRSWLGQARSFNTVHTFAFTQYHIMDPAVGSTALVPLGLQSRLPAQHKETLPDVCVSGTVSHGHCPR